MNLKVILFHKNVASPPDFERRESHFADFFLFWGPFTLKDMLFNSLSYAILLPFVFLIYWFDHVNEKGAAIVTKDINRRIEELEKGEQVAGVLRK